MVHFAGILTGTATVISAGLGVMGVMNAGDSNNSASQTQGTGSNPTPATSPAPVGTPTVFTDFPEASVNPASVDFGKQGLTNSEPKTLLVINSGESDLEFGEIRLTGDDADEFEIVQDTCGSEAISPDSRCQIRVVFSPSGVGSVSAILELEHNAMDTPTEVPLSGEGVLLQL